MLWDVLQLALLVDVDGGGVNQPAKVRQSFLHHVIHELGLHRPELAVMRQTKVKSSQELVVSGTLILMELEIADGIVE